MDVPDVYPQDDSELDAMHPFAKEEEQTEEWRRQKDHEELLAVLLVVPTESMCGALADALLFGARLDDENIYIHRSATEAIAEFAEQYGWRLTLKTVADFLPVTARG